MDGWVQAEWRKGWSGRLLERQKHWSVERKKNFPGKNKEVLNAELWAILEALGIVRKETFIDNQKQITIFSGSQKVLKIIQQPLSHQENRF